MTIDGVLFSWSRPQQIVAETRGRISHEIQKSIARAGWRFLREKRYHANLRYAENRSIPFSRLFARVTQTHFTDTFRIHEFITLPLGQNGNGLKTDKNGNHTEIKRKRNGITRPVVRTVNGNFFDAYRTCTQTIEQVFYVKLTLRMCVQPL